MTTDLVSTVQSMTGTTTRNCRDRKTVVTDISAASAAAGAAAAAARATASPSPAVCRRCRCCCWWCA